MFTVHIEQLYPESRLRTFDLPAKIKGGIRKCPSQRMPIICASAGCFRFLHRFETRARQRRLRLKIEANVHTFQFTPCKNGKWVKCLSEFYEFNLRPNLGYTFGGASLVLLQIPSSRPSPQTFPQFVRVQVLGFLAAENDGFETQHEQQHPPPM